MHTLGQALVSSLFPKYVGTYKHSKQDKRHLQTSEISDKVHPYIQSLKTERKMCNDAVKTRFLKVGDDAHSKNTNNWKKIEDECK